ncbi:MAG: lysophospholipid acyltransferase family protein [Deltaproteobacteria bacterium]|nr:lysophospholipid acyltransferase family protein [Deltaproteobacteria bacterium]
MEKKEPKRHHIGHRIVHLAVLAYLSFSRLLPMKTWLLIGKYFGRLFYILDFSHRRISGRNIRFAFGNEKDQRDIKTIARKSFEQFGMTGNEWVLLRDMSKETLRSLVQVEGKEHLDAARRKSRSVILLGAHFGNWEYAHAYYASTINTLNFIVRSIDNPLLERERLVNNQRFGVRILYKENGLRQAIRRLKNGQDLVIFADRREGYKQVIPCRFFNKKTSTMTLVPALARKYRIPVVPMFIVRNEDLIHHRLLFFPELNVEYDKDKERSIHEATQQQSNIIERIVREHPDHWAWLHKRWKKDTPSLYPEDMARRARKKAKKMARATQ